MTFSVSDAIMKELCPTLLNIIFFSSMRVMDILIECTAFFRSQPIFSVSLDQTLTAFHHPDFIFLTVKPSVNQISSSSKLTFISFHRIMGSNSCF